MSAKILVDQNFSHSPIKTIENKGFENLVTSQNFLLTFFTDKVYEISKPLHLINKKHMTRHGLGHGLFKKYMTSLGGR